MSNALRIIFVLNLSIIFKCSSQQLNEQEQKKDSSVFIPVHKCRKIICYPFLVDKAEEWCKRTWRTIDLRKKINSFFIKNSAQGISLFDFVLKGIENSEINAFKEEDFIQSLAYCEIVEKLKIEKNILNYDSQGKKFSPSKISASLESNDIVRIKLKEDWSFSKKESVLSVEIKGISFEWYDAEKNSFVSLFWLNFQQCKLLFSELAAYNLANDAERRTFYDLFDKRMFESEIEKETNVYEPSFFSYPKAIEIKDKTKSIRKNVSAIEKSIWSF